MHRRCELPLALLVPLLLLATPACARAEVPGPRSAPELAAGGEPEHPGHEHAIPGKGHESGAPDPAQRVGPAAAWAALWQVRDSIAADVDEGRLSEVHPKAERLTPLASALLESSHDLAPERRARVESAVKQMPKAADLLHEAADAGNGEATRRELKRLDGLLELIRAQYPEGALSGGAGSHHGELREPQSDALEGGARHLHASRSLAQVDLPAAVTLRVRATEFELVPRVIELRAGEATRIEFENDGLIEHALVVKAPDGAAEWIHLHAVAKATDAGTFRLEQAGRYRLFCTVPGHTEAGMVGELVVRGS